jgi:PTS system ascorbate-specific IIC component
LDPISYLFSWISQEVFGKPAYLIGIMTAIGLIASRRGLGDILGGTLKATLGYVILAAGAGIVITALTPFGAIIFGATGANGVVPTNEAITALVNAKPAFGTDIAYAMFFGVILSLVIARLTPLRYIFLTGHHMLFMATVLTVVLLSQKATDVLAVIGGAVGLATMMVVMPAFAQPWMKKLTGGQPMAIGHFNTLSYITSGFLGQYVGKGSRSTEELNLPQTLKFLRDPMVGTAVSMIVLYLLFGIALLLRVGEAAAIKAAGGSVTGGVGGFLAAQFGNALSFGAGVAVILLGVRTILGEIIPAFSGIAERVVPGAVPALDIPVTYTFAPNAVIIGFLMSVLGGLVGFVALSLVLSPLFALPLILPGMVPHFFDGAGAGVFGNATGGRRGAVVGGFVNGLIITFLAAILVPIMSAIGFVNTTFGDSDFQWFGIVVGNVARLGGVTAVIGVIVVSGILIAAASWWQRHYVETGWTPGEGNVPAPVGAAGAATPAR